jgi:hypothetical protein
MPIEEPKLSLEAVEICLAAVEAANFGGKDVELVCRVKAELRAVRDFIKASAAPAPKK